MFPTPPMLDNHPHSPQPTNNNMAPTPPEVCGQSGQSNTDVIKNMTEEINDILTELKVYKTYFVVYKTFFVDIVQQATDPLST